MNKVTRAISVEDFKDFSFLSVIASDSQSGMRIVVKVTPEINEIVYIVSQRSIEVGVYTSLSEAIEKYNEGVTQ